MSGTLRHGRNARIYIDTSAAGTFAAGTTNLEVINGKNTWTLDQSVDFVDVTSFGDVSKSSVAGLPNATGDINGSFDLAGTLIYNAMGQSTERAIVVFPDFTNNASTYFLGKAFFSAKYGGAVGSQVTLDIHFEAGPSGISWSHP